MNNWQMSGNNKWEYSRYVFNWQQNRIDLDNQKLDWDKMWEMFSKLGNEGWEMVSCTPISAAGYGHGSGDTNLVLFVFKRMV